MKTTLLALSLAASLAAPSAFQTRLTGHGRPMILIPGLSSGGETWDSTVEHFKNRFECHVITVAGFAGVPRTSAASPMLDRVVDDLAKYIRDRGLRKPVIVGHSLGGFLALKFAIAYPDLAGSIVDVDGYADYLTLTATGSTPEQAKAIGESIKKNMSGMTRPAYEAYVTGGAATRFMVTRDADFQTLVKWGLASDPKAVGEALGEMYETDLRADLAKIQAPTLVLAAWKSYAEYTDHTRHMATLRNQFANLRGVRIELNDAARHFIMWDDPQWMFSHMDRFLAGQ